MMEILPWPTQFVDLFGNIHDIRKAWDRHWKLFPHIMRPSTSCDYSSNELQGQSKKSEEPEGMSTNSLNQSNENPSKTVLVKQLVENPALMSKSISPLKEVVKCEQKPYGKEDNEIERQESIAGEAIHVQRPSIPEGSELDMANKVFNESQNLAQIPHASSEYHETEIPIKSCVKEDSDGNLQPPALDNLSIANTLTCCDNSTPQEVASKKLGNKPEDECDASSSIHSSYEKNLNCELNFQEKFQEESSLPFLASHATRMVTKTARHSTFQEKMNANQALPVKTKHPQIASGGQLAQVYHDAQVIADPNQVLHGYMQNSRPQQWQVRADMQNQSGGANLQVSLTQGHVSQTPGMNPQDSHGYHTQLQYQQAASQAYTNPNLAFLGQHMQQPASVYTQDQLQQASSQTQIQVYQSMSQSDGQFGYYQNMQGFSPDIWLYYQNLYYFQQQQMQQRQLDEQVNFNSHRQQWTDPSQASSSQREVLENQEEKCQMQIHSDTLQHNNLDDKLNAPNQQNNQPDKPEESTQPQSTQVMNFEQSQLLYLQQQQQFYLQQQHQHLMYLQQQHLLQQQQHQQQQHQQQQHQQQHQQQQQYQQQQQHHQQLLIFQQQQLLQLQHQQQISIPLPQQEQLQCLQQQQQISLQQHHLMQQPTEAAEFKSVENCPYPQGKGDPIQSVGQSANSSSS